MPPDLPPDIEIYEYMNQPSIGGGFIVLLLFFTFIAIETYWQYKNKK